MAQAKAFDAYREALVVETETVWPETLEPLDADQQARIAQQLHADPQQAAELEYLRVPTGFCRQITVTAEDVARLQD
jgi:hypothetical protein